ncbi:signal recognition particle protein [archaeon]|mgnify:CR=1 FL=1|jgi:signal recognition particle subunit SRP54|nr:signal recognition particle protein [archaeon]
MLEKLGGAIKKATDKIANAIFLDKNLVQSIVKDLQRALIEADVNIMLVKEISDKIKQAAIDERIKEIDKKEHVIKLLHEELLRILGEHKNLELQKQNRIMLLGLYGAGKTTTISKLANYYQKRGKKVATISLDVHRPGAPEQLQQLAEQNGLTAFVNLTEKNPEKILKEFEKDLKKYEVVLIDTAGRHNLDKDLVKEIKTLNKKIKPTERILVMPADIGQTAKTQAKEFQDAVDITGVIITRMDSTAKAGGALTACAETKAPVYFIGNGEKVNDIEEFNPETFLSRLLGMGDLSSLMEKIKSVIDEKGQAKMQKQLEAGKISLTDVIEQVKSMSQLGGFDKLKGMIPGMNNAKIPDNLMQNQQDKIAKWEHIIKSMTQEERDNPEILKKETKRISRIAEGSGVNNSDIRALLKQYDMLNDMMKMGPDMDMSQGMDEKQMKKLMKKFGKTKKMRF